MITLITKFRFRNDTVLWLRFSFFYYGWTWYVILEYVFFVQNSKQGVRCHNVADAGRVKQPFVRQIAFIYFEYVGGGRQSSNAFTYIYYYISF